jgi:hypothetical protein
VERFLTLELGRSDAYCTGNVYPMITSARPNFVV